MGNQIHVRFLRRGREKGVLLNVYIGCSLENGLFLLKAGHRSASC